MLRGLALRYCAPLIATSAAFLVWSLLLQDLLPHPYLLLLGAVALVAWDGGIGPSLLAIALGCFYGFLAYGISANNLGAAPSGSIAQTMVFLFVSLCVVVAHDALRRQLQSAATAAYGTADALCVIDSRGRITWLNTAMEDILKRPRHELLGKSLHGTVCRCSDTGGARRSGAECVIIQAATDRETREDTTLFQRRDGGEFRAEWTVRPLMGGVGPRKSVLAFRDVSDLNELLTNLRQSELLYRTILESAPLAGLVVDEYGYVVIANTQAAELFGYERSEDMISLSTQQLLVPEDRLRCSQERHKVLEAGGKKDIELTAQRRDGATRHVEFAMAVIPDGTAEMRKLTVLIRDLSQRALDPDGYFIEAYGGEPDPEVAVAGVLAEANTLAEAMPRVLQILCSSGGWDVGTYWSIDSQDNVLRCQAIWRLPSIEVPEFEILCQQLALPPDMDLPGRVWASRKSIWVPDVVADPTILRALMASKEGLRSAFAFPLMSGSSVRAVVEVLSQDVRSPSAYLEDKMSIIGRQMGRFLDRRETERSLVHQARHDPLTDLPNRVLLGSRLSRAFVNARTGGKSLAVLLIDLDGFKQINDTHGHHYGDIVLQHVASRIRGVLRDSDTVARIGGDEFAVLLPGTPLSGSRVVAEKILEAHRDPITADGVALSVGCSIGIAIYPDHAEDIETLMQRADAAMYAAKHAQSGYSVHTEGSHRLHG